MVCWEVALAARQRADDDWRIDQAVNKLRSVLNAPQALSGLMLTSLLGVQFESTRVNVRLSDNRHDLEAQNVNGVWQILDYNLVKPTLKQRLSVTREPLALPAVSVDNTGYGVRHILNAVDSDLSRVRYRYGKGI